MVTFFMSYFINGLKEEIKLEVKIFNPKIMMDTISLVKLAEDKANAHRWNVGPPFIKTYNISYPPNNSSAHIRILYPNIYLVLIINLY